MPYFLPFVTTSMNMLPPPAYFNIFLASSTGSRNEFGLIKGAHTDFDGIFLPPVPERNNIRIHHPLSKYSGFNRFVFVFFRLVIEQHSYRGSISVIILTTFHAPIKEQ